MKVLLSSLCLALVVYTVVEVDVVDGHPYPNQPVDLDQLRELLEERELDDSSDEDVFEGRAAPAIGLSNLPDDSFASETQQADEEVLLPDVEEERAFADPAGEIVDDAVWDDSMVEEPEDRFFSDSLENDELDDVESDLQREFDDDLLPPQQRADKPAAYVDEVDSAMEEFDGFDAAARNAWPNKDVDETVPLDELEARSEAEEQSRALKATPDKSDKSNKDTSDKYSSLRQKLQKLYQQKVTQAQQYDGVVDFGVLGKLKLSGVVVTLADDRKFFIRRRIRNFGGRRRGATSIVSASKMNDKFWKTSGDPKKVEKSKVVDYVKACQSMRNSAGASKKMMTLN